MYNQTSALDPLIKEGFVKGLGLLAKKFVNTGRRGAGVVRRATSGTSRSLAQTGQSVANKVRGNIAVTKSNFKQGYTGKASRLSPEKLKNQAILKAQLKKQQALKAQGKTVRPNLPKDVAPNPASTNWMGQAKNSWNKLTPQQKGLAKGTAVGAGAVVGVNALRGPSNNTQQQGYYR